jgi:hypothetical protein
VPARAGAHEASRHHRAPLVGALVLVERLAMHEPSRATRAVAALLLNQEPVREAVDRDLRAGSPGTVDSGGGAYRRGSGNPVKPAIFLVTRGSTISSSVSTRPQLSSPATIPECLSRSISDPGPQVVITWLRRTWQCPRFLTVPPRPRRRPDLSAAGSGRPLLQRHARRRDTGCAGRRRSLRHDRSGLGTHSLRRGHRPLRRMGSAPAQRCRARSPGAPGLNQHSHTHLGGLVEEPGKQRQRPSGRRISLPLPT